jgi:hypothetical protein
LGFFGLKTNWQPWFSGGKNNNNLCRKKIRVKPAAGNVPTKKNEKMREK